MSARVKDALRDYLPAVLLFVAVLVIWEASVALFNVQRFILPPPSVIWQAFTTNFQRLVGIGWFTTKEALGGFAIGSAAGFIMALLTARFVFVREGMMPFAIAANSVPIIALSPIMFNWFGPTNPVSWMMIVAIMVFFPVLINTVRGLTEVKPEALELMHSYAASDLKILFSLRVPNALPFLFSALRVASVLSMIGAIVADFFGAERNTVGKYVTQEAASLRFDNTWAAVLVASLIGILFYSLVVWVEGRVTPWAAAEGSRDS